MPTIAELQNALRIGLAVVSEQWNYKAKDWVISVCVADIDDDGEVEVLLGSRDGRMHALTREGDVRWQRIVGNKSWIGSLAAIAPIGRGLTGMRLVAGTRDGNLYILDKDGKTIGKDGRTHSYEKDGWPDEADKAAVWYHTEQTIRQIYATPRRTAEIIFGSEDRCVYALDLRTGLVRWKYQTGGRVRAVYSCDINGDGRMETLVGSSDKYLSILDTKGNCLTRLNMERQIYTLSAADVDNDGVIEILVGTDGKDLSAFTPDLILKWQRTFEHRFYALSVTDLDNDGENEIIAGSEDKHLYILDEEGRVIWRHNLGQRIFSVYVRDLDKDGHSEILVGCDDSRIHVLRISSLIKGLERKSEGSSIKGLERKIRRTYQALGKPPLSALTELSQAERTLLDDILTESSKPHARAISFKQVEELAEAQDHWQALQLALHLKQQQAQVLWHRDEVGYVRSLCFGDISGDPKLEIIIGNDRGDIQAYTSFGRQLWSRNLGGQLLTIQTGYLNHEKWANIVACSTDHHIYVLSGVAPVSGTKQNKVAPQTRSTHFIDEWMSSIQLTALKRYAEVEMIVGTEDKKIHIYRNDLSTPAVTIETPQGIKILCAHAPQKDDGVEIIAGSLGNQVYAYTRSGVLLWTYETYDRVLALCMRDVDNDGNVEVIVGSESRNIYVLDDQGRLQWRYYLPDRILAVEAADINGDQYIEILAGCGNGYLYAFSHDGNLLWQYKSNDRIRAVLADDINVDGHTEIVIGSEDRLEVLQMLPQQRLCQIIEQSWQGLQLPCTDLFQHADPLLRAFAVGKYAEQSTLTPLDYERVEEWIARERAPEVRKTLVYLLIRHYASQPLHIQPLLLQLLVDPEQSVKLAVLDHLPTLMSHDADFVLECLQRLSSNSDRFIRRGVIRTIYRLLHAPHEKYLSQFFALLLTHALDRESIWIKQEAARPLALLLDLHYEDLIISLLSLVIKGVAPDILLQISYHAQKTLVQDVLRGMIPLLDGVNDDNVQERLERAVQALEEVRVLKYGEELWLVYHELLHLFSLSTIDNMARYQCILSPSTATTNAYYAVVLRILNHLSSITRKLRLYLLRQSLDDRLAGLLEANQAIGEARHFVAQEYEVRLQGEPIHKLPDYLLFTLLLQRWQNTVLARLSELRGKAELTAELKTKQARQEEQVGVMLVVRNAGRSSANNVKVTLLHSNEFEIAGQRSFEIETILARAEMQLEFLIRPQGSSANLVFEVAYSDIGPDMKVVLLGDRLELEASEPREFSYIPNPYSTGTPTHDSKMFYGREQDIAFLKDNLARSAARTVIVLYGQRRSGKTTLLHHLVNTSILDEHIPLLIDMQRFAYSISAGKFFHNIAFYMYRALKQRAIEVEQPQAQQFEADPTFAFDLFLDEVEARLSNQRIILLIDEFEVLEDLVLKKKLEPEIFGYIRSLMQHRPYLNFLLSGTHQIEQLIKGYWSVFFNIARHYHLGRLGEQDAIALIRKPVEGALEYETHALQKIRQLTADQPYLIHLICRSLVDHCNERRKSYVTLNDVNEVLREVMQTGQFHFSWIWDNIQPEERIAICMLAHASKEEWQSVSLLEIEELYKHHHLPYKREGLTTHLKALIDADIIENITDHTQNGSADMARYRIPVGLIRQWLRKEKPVELVLREEITQ